MATTTPRQSKVNLHRRKLKHKAKPLPNPYPQRNSNCAVMARFRDKQPMINGHTEGMEKFSLDSANALIGHYMRPWGRNSCQIPESGTGIG